MWKSCRMLLPTFPWCLRGWPATLPSRFHLCRVRAPLFVPGSSLLQQKTTTVIRWRTHLLMPEGKPSKLNFTLAGIIYFKLRSLQITEEKWMRLQLSVHPLVGNQLQWLEGGVTEDTFPWNSLDSCGRYMSVLSRPPSDSLHWSWVLSLASVSVCFWNLQRASVELAEFLPDPTHTLAHTAHSWKWLIIFKNSSR